MHVHQKYIHDDVQRSIAPHTIKTKLINRKNPRIHSGYSPPPDSDADTKDNEGVPCAFPWERLQDKRSADRPREGSGGHVRDCSSDYFWGTGLRGGGGGRPRRGRSFLLRWGICFQRACVIFVRERGRVGDGDAVSLRKGGGSRRGAGSGAPRGSPRHLHPE